MTPYTNGTNPAEALRKAYQEAEAARNDAVNSLLSAAERIRAEADGDDRAATIARSLEQNANFLNARKVDHLDERPIEDDDPAWITWVLVFLAGVFFGRRLSRGQQEDADV
jgi:hypothetical protein